MNRVLLTVLNKKKNKEGRIRQLPIFLVCFGFDRYLNCNRFYLWCNQNRGYFSMPLKNEFFPLNWWVVTAKQASIVHRTACAPVHIWLGRARHIEYHRAQHNAIHSFWWMLEVVWFRPSWLQSEWKGKFGKGY